MQRLFLLILFCSAGFCARARQVVRLAQDSLGMAVESGWLFRAQDNPAFADPAYNDEGWKEINARYIPVDSLKGVGWLRLHIHADSSVAGEPIAIRFSQYGASEVYVDGRRIRRYGRVGRPGDVIYYDPQYMPAIVVLNDTGRHVVSIRYANYEAGHNKRFYGKSFTGFQMLVGDAPSVISNESQSRVAQSFMFALMFGIFIAISLLHLFLYLYHRAAISNFSFSMFSLMLALLFFSGAITRFSTTPFLELWAGFLAFFWGLGAAIFLHLFLRHIFERKNKVWDWVIYGLSAAICVLRCIDFKYGLVALMAMIVLVSVEAVITIIKAMFRRVKGARIVGAGLLSFTGIILVITAVTIASGGNFEVNDESTSGTYWFLAIFSAILSIPISMSAYLAYRFSDVNKSLQKQLRQVRLLSEKNLEQELEKKKLLEVQNEKLEEEVSVRTAEVLKQKEQIEAQHEALKTEKKKSDDLLLNILPSEIAEELKAKGHTEARLYDEVTVLFTDFVDFTLAGEKMSAQQLVNELDHCFKTFDDIISRYGIEKIKTIGDAYLAVCGLPNSDDDHAAHALLAAIEIRDFMTRRKEMLGDQTFQVRVGVHSGPVVAGIVGVKKFAYDIWGDTVNTAARMEQSSEPGKINISETTFEMVRHRFVCDYRGEITAKNKGAMKMYFVRQEATAVAR